jgi:hypothetical protein
MKFIWYTARYNLLDHRENEDILEELDMKPIQKKLAQSINKTLLWKYICKK